MVTAVRSKKKVQLYKKAIIHFLLCFVMGFFTGCAPTGKFSISSSPAFSPQPAEGGRFNTSLLQESEGEKSLEKEGNENLIPKRLIIFVTPTRTNDKLRGVNLRRLSNTLRLVPPPFLWVVVELKSDSSELSEILRETGIVYRHLVLKENFTDSKVEMDHQRNLALNHIEHHRLSGIVHFAGLSNVYHLQFFNEIRAIEVFGTWPMALISANSKRLNIEGPVCSSSKVVGDVRKTSNITDAVFSLVHISSFTFNSSILWDPERWGLSSVQNTTQDIIKFVKKEVLEEEPQLIGIPAEGCSKIMVWNVHIPTGNK